MMIAAYLEISLESKIKKINNKDFIVYSLKASNSKSHNLVCEYFNEYPLLYYKYSNYSD